MLPVLHVSHALLLVDRLDRFALVDVPDFNASVMARAQNLVVLTGVPGDFVNCLRVLLEILRLLY